MLINQWTTNDCPNWASSIFTKAKKLTVRIAKGNFNGTGAVLAYQHAAYHYARVFVVTARHNVEMAQEEKALEGEEQKAFWKKAPIALANGIKIYFDGTGYDAAYVRIPVLRKDVAVIAVQSSELLEEVKTLDSTRESEQLLRNVPDLPAATAKYYVRMGYGFSQAVDGRNGVTKSNDKVFTCGKIPVASLRSGEGTEAAKKLKAAIVDQGSSDGNIISFAIPNDNKDTSLEGDSGGPVFGFYQIENAPRLVQVGVNTGANLFSNKTDDSDWPHFENNGFTLLDKAFYSWCERSLFH
jgi:hypothetical protein